jgi:hypothetical protein
VYKKSYSLLCIDTNLILIFDRFVTSNLYTFLYRIKLWQKENRQEEKENWQEAKKRIIKGKRCGWKQESPTALVFKSMCVNWAMTLLLLS